MLAGAYATGILVMMVSAAIAVTVAARRAHSWPAAVGFGVVTAVFTYALVDNVIEKPDGIAIAAIFIFFVMVISFISRLLRSSISHALTHRDEAVEYAQQFGRGLDRSRTDRFVGMYVNDLTLDYGPRGRAGLERLYADAYDRGLIPSRMAVEFVA